MPRARPSATRRWFCIALCVLLLAGCAKEPETLPTELIGDWATDSPQHADRSFEIRANAVVFGTGRFSKSDLYRLVAVRRGATSGGWETCTLIYREFDGSLGELDLQYSTGPRPELRFSSRPEIWTRRAKKGGVKDA